VKAYLDLLKDILENGIRKENRTGIDVLGIDSAIFKHDMSTGFPIQTTKKVLLRLIASELEFFIKGITDKRWLQERDNHIWDEWCNPDKVSYGHDEDTKQRMKEERDLGPVYGFQWRHFGAEYCGYDADYTGKGVDQLAKLVNTLKKDPNNRRMIVSAWNPMDLGKMALPPCHYAFQVTTTEDRVNLFWNQRSVDTVLGLPFNIAGYALLLHLLAKESGMKEGQLTGFLGDVHIYENHLKGVEEMLGRELYQLPKVETENFSSIFDWNYKQTKLLGYEHHPAIKFDVAV